MGKLVKPTRAPKGKMPKTYSERKFWYVPEGKRKEVQGVKRVPKSPATQLREMQAYVAREERKDADYEEKLAIYEEEFAKKKEALDEVRELRKYTTSKGIPANHKPQQKDKKPKPRLKKVS